MEVAASPQIYMGDARKWNFSHQILDTPNPQSLIPSYSTLLSNLVHGRLPYFLLSPL
mgnify:CR=1 FL=1